VAALLLWHLVPGFDAALHVAFRLRDAGSWTARTRLLTDLGSAAAMIPIALVGVALLTRARRRAEALWLLATIAGGRVLVEGSKLMFARARPPVEDRLELVSSLSFPSSHSAGTMMTCIALALIVRRGWGWPVALGLAVLVGWTRVALAVHWPTDVLGGWGFGMLWVGLAMRWLPRVHDPVAADIVDGRPD
jgi:undecaprenyl-diphosphatase